MPPAAVTFARVALGMVVLLVVLRVRGLRLPAGTGGVAPLRRRRAVRQRHPLHPPGVGRAAHLVRPHRGAQRGHAAVRGPAGGRLPRRSGCAAASGFGLLLGFVGRGGGRRPRGVRPGRVVARRGGGGGRGRGLLRHRHHLRQAPPLRPVPAGGRRRPAGDGHRADPALRRWSPRPGRASTSPPGGCWPFACSASWGRGWPTSCSTGSSPTSVRPWPRPSPTWCR